MFSPVALRPTPLTAMRSAKVQPLKFKGNAAGYVVGSLSPQQGGSHYQVQWDPNDDAAQAAKSALEQHAEEGQFNGPFKVIKHYNATVQGVTAQFLDLEDIHTGQSINQVFAGHFNLNLEQ